MNAEALVAELEGILEAERGAIRRLDGAAVLAAAVRKEEIAAALAKRPREELARSRDALARLAGPLKHNTILLAHARACLAGARAAIRVSTEL